MRKSFATQNAYREIVCDDDDDDDDDDDELSKPLRPSTRGEQRCFLVSSWVNLQETQEM